MTKKNLLKTTIAALAFIVSFNSCKEDEFKLPEETINAIRIKNGAVVEDTLIKDSYQLRAGTSVHDNILIGTSIDNLESLYDNYKLKPYTTYFWKIVVTDGDNSAETDILKFYCVPKFPVEVKNEDEDDWSATVKWKKYEQFGDMRITLVPDSECDYDKAPIAVTKGESLCRISAGPLQTPKYAIYHQWWDDSKRQYYEPVIYDFTVNADCEFDDTVITAQSTAKGIFLNKSVAVADKQYNVYKIGKIGNRVWMLEDLRGTLDLSDYNDGDIFDYIYGLKHGDKGLPLIAVPTTCGTGSEGNCFAVLTNTENNDKKSLRNIVSVPKASIVDPQLMTTMPNSVAASVMFDALCHSMEAYISKSTQPLVEMQAIYAMRLMAVNIRNALNDHGDMDAWSAVTLASTLGGMCINVAGVTAPHGMEHPASGLRNIVHGRGLAALSPVIYHETLEYAPEKFGTISKIFGGKSEADFEDQLNILLQDIDLKTSLSKEGIEESDIDWMVKNCMKVSGASMNAHPKLFS